MKTSIVFTTINLPTVAEDYCKNLEKFGHKNEAGIIIVGDKKSPNEESFKIVKDFKKRGFDVEYFDIAAQEKWLEKFPKLKGIIPYNTDNRRNIGFLMAKEKSSDLLISIDDDDFPLENVDFLGGHRVVGQKIKLPVVDSKFNWFNICDLLSTETKERIFPRGFPYKVRLVYKQEDINFREKEVLIMLNEGLWVGDPDVDAITRLERNSKITGFKNENQLVALEIGTFSPINSQNTALHISLLPAYYFVVMGYQIENLEIDRFGDIWSGFFIKKVMDKLGFYASFGNPLSEHRRNIHNLFSDLKKELNGIVYSEIIAEFLEEIDLKGDTVVDVYSDLSDKLLKFVLNDSRFGEDFRAYIKKLHFCQNTWLEALGKLS